GELTCSSIPVGTGPRTPAFNPQNKDVYVTNEGSNPGTVSVINSGSHTVTSTIPVGTNPEGAAFAPGDLDMYFSNLGSGDVYAFDIENDVDTLVAQIPVGSNPAGVGSIDPFIGPNGMISNV